MKIRQNPTRKHFDDYDYCNTLAHDFCSKGIKTVSAMLGKNKSSVMMVAKDFSAQTPKLDRPTTPNNPSKGNNQDADYCIIVHGKNKRQGGKSKGMCVSSVSIFVIAKHRNQEKGSQSDKRFPFRSYSHPCIPTNTMNTGVNNGCGTSGPRQYTPPQQAQQMSRTPNKSYFGGGGANFRTGMNHCGIEPFPRLNEGPGKHCGTEPVSNRGVGGNQCGPGGGGHFGTSNNGCPSHQQPPAHCSPCPMTNTAPPNCCKRHNNRAFVKKPHKNKSEHATKVKKDNTNINNKAASNTSHKSQKVKSEKFKDEDNQFPDNFVGDRDESASVIEEDLGDENGEPDEVFIEEVAGDAASSLHGSTLHDPSTIQSSLHGGSTLYDPSLHDPSQHDPSLQSTLHDPSLHDPSLHDPSLQSTLHGASTIQSSLHGPPSTVTAGGNVTEQDLYNALTASTIGTEGPIVEEPPDDDQEGTVRGAATDGTIFTNQSGAGPYGSEANTQVSEIPFSNQTVASQSGFLTEQGNPTEGVNNSGYFSEAGNPSEQVNGGFLAEEGNFFAEDVNSSRRFYSETVPSNGTGVGGGGEQEWDKHDEATNTKKSSKKGLPPHQRKPKPTKPYKPYKSPFKFKPIVHKQPSECARNQLDDLPACHPFKRPYPPQFRFNEKRLRLYMELCAADPASETLPPGNYLMPSCTVGGAGIKAPLKPMTTTGQSNRNRQNGNYGPPGAGMSMSRLGPSPSQQQGQNRPPPQSGYRPQNPSQQQMPYGMPYQNRAQTPQNGFRPQMTPQQNNYRAQTPGMPPQTQAQQQMYSKSNQALNARQQQQSLGSSQSSHVLRPSNSKQTTSAWPAQNAPNGYRPPFPPQQQQPRPLPPPNGPPPNSYRQPNPYQQQQQQNAPNNYRPQYPSQQQAQNVPNGYRPPFPPQQQQQPLPPPNGYRPPNPSQQQQQNAGYRGQYPSQQQGTTLPPLNASGGYRPPSYPPPSQQTTTSTIPVKQIYQRQ